jgi:hypothetical protein
MNEETNYAVSTVKVEPEKVSTSSSTAEPMAVAGS